MNPSAQPRRFAADPDTPVVVTLKDYVDVQVDAVDRRVSSVESQAASAVDSLRSELGSFKGEVRSGLAGVTRELQAMREHDARSAGSLSAFQKLGVFVVGFVAVVAPVASLIVALTHP